MNRQEFGRLVTALRKEHRDENDEVWTQAKIAELTNLGESLIGKIERGERVNLEPSLLFSLADVLELTSRERKEFFYAATGLEAKLITRDTTTSEKVLNDLLDMMRKVQLPAFIVDGYADILAFNTMILQLLRPPAELLATARIVPAGCNMLRLIFAPNSNHSDIIGNDYSLYASNVLRFIRAISLRYRATRCWQSIFSAARKWPLFRMYWSAVPWEEADHYIDSTLFHYSHPIYGPLNYFYTTVEAVTAHGELYFLTYIPADVRTVEVFAELQEKYKSDVRRLAPWPKKE